MAELIEIFPHNIDQRKINHLVGLLKQGNIIIIPTDTIYALVGDLNNKHVMEKLCRLVNKKPNKVNLSILCQDLSNLSNYTQQIDNSTYKLMNRLTPGTFTFIMSANSNVPKIFRQNKKTIGIRVPDNEIVQSILRTLGNPLVTTSMKSDDQIQEYLTEVDEIYEYWNEKVAAIVDGGAGGNVPSTIIDLTEDEPYIVREGKGIELI